VRNEKLTRFSVKPEDKGYYYSGSSYVKNVVHRKTASFAGHNQAVVILETVLGILVA
jgi:hypothetical protein